MIAPLARLLPLSLSLTQVGVVAFTMCWIACVGAWVWALLDHRGVRRQSARVLGQGVPLWQLRDPEFWQVNGSAQLPPFSTPGGHVLPLDAERIAFFPRLGGAFELRSGLSGLLLYTGMISWREGPAVVTVRAPWGLPAFVVAWVCGWLVFAFMIGPVHACLAVDSACHAHLLRTMLMQASPAVAVLAIGGAGAIGIRRRAQALYAEVREGVRTQAPASTPAPGASS